MRINIFVIYRTYKKIQEVVVIHDSHIEVIDRELLKQQDVLNKFDCGRVDVTHRSLLSSIELFFFLNIVT